MPTTLHTTVQELLHQGHIGTRTIRLLNAAALYTIGDIVKRFEKIEDIATLEGLGPKCYGELEAALQEFYARKQEEFLVTEELYEGFAFLSASEQKHVSIFEEKHQHLPMLFLLYRYMVTSKNFTNQLYCQYHGLYGEPAKDYTELAREHSLTDMTVRKWLDAELEVRNNELMKHPHWKCYESIKRRPYITEDMEEFYLLRKEEGLPDDFSLFAHILPIVAHFGVYIVKKQIVAVNYDKLRTGDVVRLIYRLKDLLSAHSKQYLPLLSLAPELPEAQKDDFLDMACFIVRQYELKLTDDMKAYCPQRVFDLEHAVLDVLAEDGNPMTVEQITQAIKSKYPDVNKVSLRKIKSIVRNNPTVFQRGRTPTYSLNDRKEEDMMSIRELLVSFLSQRDSPIHLDELTNYVLKYYPSTKKSHIRTSMMNDRNKRFIKTSDGYYGLTRKTYKNNKNIQIERNSVLSD